MEDIFLNGLAYTLPALVTGGVAYYIFAAFLNQNSNEKKLELLAQKKKESLHIKLQAYERMLLFCERINPVKLLVRVKPINSNKEDYLQLLIANIEQEFEHNLVQQLYLSNQCWSVIIAAKRAVLTQLKTIEQTSENSANFRENVLSSYTEKEPPTATAVAFLKEEVKKMI